jgi:hypothetical protein
MGMEPKTWVMPDPPGPEVRYLRTADGNLFERASDDGISWRYWQRRFARGVVGAPYRWTELLGSGGLLTDVTAEIEGMPK